MSLLHSPNIVRNGLVLYYDMGNTKKSYLGAPTTNVLAFPEANWNGTSFPLTYNTDTTSTHTFTYVTGERNPINSPGVLRYTTGTTGYKFWALRGTVPSSGTYTFSYYARISSGSSSNLNNQQLWRDTDVDKAVTGNWNPTLTNQWQRYSTTGTVTTYLDYFPIHNNPITGGFSVDYCGFQLEAGSVASRWLNGTRSNTQSLIDLTGNNTLTCSSLTYAADDTFSFNGSSNLIVSPNNTLLDTQSPSVSVWVRPASLNQNGHWFEKGNLNLQYSLFQEGTNIRWRQKPSSAAFSTLTVSNVGLLSTSTWSNVAATYNSTTGARRIYVNGQLVASDTSAFTVATDSGGVSMGVYGGFNSGRGYWYNGSMGIVSVYNTELSAAEVKQNFNALKGRYGL